MTVERERSVGWQIDQLKEHLEMVRTLDHRALELQAKEYERRLADLNHAHAESQRVLNTYIPYSVYEKDRDAFHKLENRVEVELASRSSATRGVDTIFRIATGLALLISVTVALLAFVSK
jgi:hypothetical protein